MRTGTLGTTQCSADGVQVGSIQVTCQTSKLMSFTLTNRFTTAAAEARLLVFCGNIFGDAQAPVRYPGIGLSGCEASEAYNRLNFTSAGADVTTTFTFTITSTACVLYLPECVLGGAADRNVCD